MPEDLPPAQASIQIKKTFAATQDAWAKDIAKSAAAALRNKEYDVAYAALQQLKVSGKISPAEDMAVRNAIIGISVTGAREMESGDKKAAEMMRRIREGR